MCNQIIKISKPSDSVPNISSYRMKRIHSTIKHKGKEQLSSSRRIGQFIDHEQKDWKKLDKLSLELGAGEITDSLVLRHSLTSKQFPSMFAVCPPCYCMLEYSLVVAAKEGTWIGHRSEFVEDCVRMFTRHLDNVHSQRFNFYCFCFTFKSLQKDGLPVHWTMHASC